MDRGVIVPSQAAKSGAVGGVEKSQTRSELIRDSEYIL